MIGRLKKVPVSEMYEAGGSNFTAWLQENIDVLNEAVDLSLSGVRDKASVSTAEVVAREESGGTVAIEHEPEESGDAGLGRLVTSLASAQARMGIWIVADPRPEHVAAVSWLNQTSWTSFYLLKVEAFRIDNSPPAPSMSLIIGPESGSSLSSAREQNGAAAGTQRAMVSSDAAGSPTTDSVGTTLNPDIAEDMGDTPPTDEPPEPIIEMQSEPIAEASPGIVGVAERREEAVEEVSSRRGTTGLVLYQFWAELLEKAAGKTRLHVDVEPRRETVIGTSAGVVGLDYNYVMREHDASVELRIDRGEDNRSKSDAAFNALQITDDAIAYNFGGPLEWRQDKSSGANHVEHRIEIGGYLDEERWPKIQDAMVEAMIRLEKALAPHVSRLQR